MEGYARLSPSILREFLTYTVIGLEKDKKLIEEKARILKTEIDRISRDKLELAESVIKQITESHSQPEAIKNKTAVIIAGDIVYNMAHSENRPEFSTGEVIRGSDLDIIIVTENLGRKLVQELDQRIYEQKYYLIKNPAYREEIDYIIKDIARVKEQLKFDCFEYMVASKILEEGRFLFGNQDIYRKIKKMVAEKGIPVKLGELEKTAAIERKQAKDCLIDTSKAISNHENNLLFFHYRRS
ncbi:MAG: hypothetical protein U5N58_13395 [Actinomycetota bacterium]|nr:hypothetical protein [Actinomycetota bacterium]